MKILVATKPVAHPNFCQPTFPPCLNGASCGITTKPWIFGINQLLKGALNLDPLKDRLEK